VLLPNYSRNDSKTDNIVYNCKDAAKLQLFRKRVSASFDQTEDPQGSAGSCRTPAAKELQLVGGTWRGPSCSSAGGLTMEIALYHKRRCALYISSLSSSCSLFGSVPIRSFVALCKSV